MAAHSRVLVPVPRTRALALTALAAVLCTLLSTLANAEYVPAKTAGPVQGAVCFPAQRDAKDFYKPKESSYWNDAANRAPKVMAGFAAFACACAVILSFAACVRSCCCRRRKNRAGAPIANPETPGPIFNTPASKTTTAKVRGAAPKIVVSLLTTAVLCTSLAGIAVSNSVIKDMVPGFWNIFEDARSLAATAIAEGNRTVDLCNGLRDGVLRYPKIVKRDVDTDFLNSKLRCIRDYVDLDLPDPNTLKTLLVSANDGIYGDGDTPPPTPPLRAEMNTVRSTLGTFVDETTPQMISVLAQLGDAKGRFDSLTASMSTLARDIGSVNNKQDVEKARDGALSLQADVDEMRSPQGAEIKAIDGAITLIEANKPIPRQLNANLDKIDTLTTQFRTFEIPTFKNYISSTDMGWFGPNPPSGRLPAETCAEAFLNKVQVINTTVLVLPAETSKNVGDVRRSKDRISGFLTNEQYAAKDLVANLTKMETQLDVSSQLKSAKSQLTSVQGDLDAVDVNSARSSVSQFQTHAVALSNSLRQFISACNAYIDSPLDTPLPPTSIVGDDLSETIDTVGNSVGSAVFSKTDEIEKAITDSAFQSDTKSALASLDSALSEMASLSKKTREDMITQIDDLATTYNDVLTGADGKKLSVKATFATYEEDINKTVADVDETVADVNKQLEKSCKDGEEAITKAQKDLLTKMDDAKKDYKSQSEDASSLVTPLAVVALFVPACIAAWIVCLFGSGIVPSRVTKRCVCWTCQCWWYWFFPLTAILPALVGCAIPDILSFVLKETCENIEPYVMQEYPVNARVQTGGHYYIYGEISAAANLSSYATDVQGAPSTEMQYVIHQTFNFDLRPVYKELKNGRADLYDYEKNYTLLGELRSLHDEVLTNISTVETSLGKFSAEVSYAKVKPLYLRTKNFACCELVSDFETLQSACLALVVMVLLASLASLVVSWGSRGDDDENDGNIPTAKTAEMSQLQTSADAGPLYNSVPSAPPIYQYGGTSNV